MMSGFICNEKKEKNNNTNQKTTEELYQLYKQCEIKVLEINQKIEQLKQEKMALEREMILVQDIN